ncbi:TPA: glycosyltransferase family 1 protein, partial [Candidatus Bathyarchaeota archaeon]|nr:glycosyltransferase family 1 protein [Candidatus Bathyarchaeota archaeon]
VFRRPLVATIHSTEHGRRNGLHSDYERMIHEVEWWLTFEAWRVICCSRYMSDHVHQVLGAPKDKLDVIPNGVRADEFRFEFERNGFRRRFAHPQEKMVLYVGRLVFEKGIHVLINAIPRVLASIPNAKFVIVGEGGMRRPMEDLARALGVYDKAFFTGFVDGRTLKALYQCADVCVFPSLYEPFGIVALEAMASGTPVVVSDTGGLSEIVEHDVTGVKVFPDNPDSLAWGLTRVLRDHEYAIRLAENARRKVSAVYDWDAIAERTVEVYERIMGEYERSGWR